MGIYTKTSEGWEPIASDTKAVSSFGSIIPDGNQTDEGTYTDDEGREWVWYEWADAGDYSASLSGGLYWVLTTSAGSNGPSSETGQPGTVVEGYWEFNAGDTPITVGEAFPKGPNSGQGGGGGPSSIGDFGNQGWTSWGDPNIGRGSTVGYGGADLQTRYYGYRSFITGEEKEYAPSSLRQSPFADRPGRSGYDGSTLATDGCVIIATVVNGGKPKTVPPTLTPSTIVSVPTAIVSDGTPTPILVRDLQDNRKTLYVLPGSVNDLVLNSYSVELTAGRLRGLMIASGGTSGSSYNTGGYGGGGGAGGCIGWGLTTELYIPVDGTYTFTVGGHTPRSPAAATTAFYDALNGQNSTLTGPGGVVAVAVGGGHGGNYTVGNIWGSPGQGGSGGGGYYVASNSPKSVVNGRGVPGQGFDGSLATSGGGAGGGAGGFPPGDSPNQINGGPGVNIFDLLEIDPLKDNAPAFAAAFTDSGYIGGGGGGFSTTTVGGIGGGGGGWYSGGGLSEAYRDGKDMMGAGGGGGFNTNAVAAGGCGVVLLVGDVL